MSATTAPRSPRRRPVVAVDPAYRAIELPSRDGNGHVLRVPAPWRGPGLRRASTVAGAGALGAAARAGPARAGLAIGAHDFGALLDGLGQAAVQRGSREGGRRRGHAGVGELLGAVANGGDACSRRCASRSAPGGRRRTWRSPPPSIRSPGPLRADAPSAVAGPASARRAGRLRAASRVPASATLGRLRRARRPAVADGERVVALLKLELGAHAAASASLASSSVASAR